MADATRISDVMLERYLAGDLRPEQRSRIEDAVRSTPAVAARLQEITTERNAFLSASPPAAAAHRITTRLAVEAKPRSRWQIWYLLPPVGVAAALAFGVIYQKALGPQSVASAPAVVSDEAYELSPPPPTWAAPPEPAEPRAIAVAPSADKAPSVATARPTSVIAPTKEGRQGPADERAVDRADDAELARKVQRVESKTAKKDAPANDVLGFGSGDYRAAPGSAGSAGGLGGALGGKGQGYAQPPASAPATDSETRRAERYEEKSKVRAQSESEASPDGARGSVAPTADPKPEPTKKPSPGATPAAPVMSEAAPASQAAPSPLPSPPPREAPAKAARLRDGDAIEDATDAKAVITLTRLTGGRALPVAQKDLVAGGTTLVASTTFPSGVFTVIGFRPDGKTHVYGQVTLHGEPATISVRVLPATMRLAEALFVSVTNEPIKLENAVGPNRDAQRLPLRLEISGTQRRFVITISASGD